MAKKKHNRPKKANNRKVNHDFLANRVRHAQNLGFQKQRWVFFCEVMMKAGLDCYLYEARQTLSKYITVKKPDDCSQAFKVRFSNHKPIKHRETAGDCDFFVGHTHLGIQNTEQAIEKTFAFFGVKHG